MVVLTLKREEGGWAVASHATAQGARPPEAKTQPVNRRSLPSDTLPRAREVASRLVHLLAVPSRGATSLQVEVGLEDDRIIGWEHRGFRVVESGGGPRALSEESMERLARVLLPFVQGVGQRTLALDLRGEHRAGDPTAHVQVLGARTLHPAPLPDKDPDFAAEYRAMHEDILRRWREGVRDGAELLARYSLEEMALWCVGGMLTRGAGLLFESAAPTVKRVLARGGTDAAGWLRTTLRRLPHAERVAFERFWTKVRMEGAEALSSAERQELAALMNRLERLLTSPTCSVNGRPLSIEPKRPPGRSCGEAFPCLERKDEDAVRTLAARSGSLVGGVSRARTPCRSGAPGAIRSACWSPHRGSARRPIARGGSCQRGLHRNQGGVLSPEKQR